MKNIKNLLAAAGAVVLASVANAQATLTTLETDVSDITTTATTNYIAAAALGVAVVSIGTIVMMAKKGWRLRG